MAAQNLLGFPPGIAYAARFVIVSATLWFFSRPYLTFRPSFPLASVAIGVVVFAIWIGPDLLFDYRDFWLFSNAVTGTAVSSIPMALRRNVLFLVLRTTSCIVIVPLIEELFWRGWLMRWLVNNDFQKVAYGQYVPFAFWTVAVLFASEHGPYWEVGLAAGVIYNWWIIRTRNLADCILAHAVTNGLLSVYVLMTGLWRYWL